MILTGNEILAEREAGRITIEPFERRQLNPCSYNYRLGAKILVAPDTIIESSQAPAFTKMTIPPQGLVLEPGRLYLGHTREIIGSDHYVSSLIGRSTMGRLGLWLQVTADLGHLGNLHRWTLELNVVQPLRVYPGMRIGQVTFWVPRGGLELAYHGAYAKDYEVTPSAFHKEPGLS